MTRRRVAIVGAGWSGLAAAVRCTEAGQAVTLFDMAPAVGGRARVIPNTAPHLDNGQHILIGAYRETLNLMRSVGVDPEAVLLRRPLSLLDARGRGLQLAGGPPVLAFVRAVLAMHHWTWRDRMALLRVALRWRLADFRAPTHATVADLVEDLPAAPRTELIEPLCVAALNTVASQASANVFLRVLRDALFSGSGSADLLLPRTTLSGLLPDPALQWLEHHGASIRLGHRVMTIERVGTAQWSCDGEPSDAVVLACHANEAARLAAPSAPDWARLAKAMTYEPIVTVYLRAAGGRWPAPMVALRETPEWPAQFGFDLGALDPSRRDVYALVVSGAGPWIRRGLSKTTEAALAQCRAAFPDLTWSPLRTLAERRATFACVTRLQRPAGVIANRLYAAGDYIDGPYPATLEGAVRSGVEAARLATAG
jgi:squalene-associated FAD-dependent desaturase